MRKYRLIAKKGEGTFSEVLKAQNVKDNKYHAIKCMKNHFESIDQVNNLREIQALRRLSPHKHIVKLEEVLYDQPSGRLALVFELMDANLYEMIRGRRQYLNPELIQSLMYQLVKSLDHMHNKGIFHRDIKPENILVEDNSKLKLADFGSCRGIYSKQPYTEYISTRWYRAPECLLTDGYYGPEMDMWGVGCVFFEITSLYPLFPGSNELDQIHRIHKIMGTPSPQLLDQFKRHGASHIDFTSFPQDEGTPLGQLIPHAPASAIDLMYKMLSYEPSKRMNAREALRHEYFKDICELEDITNNQTVIQGSSNISVGQGIADDPKSLSHLNSIGFSSRNPKSVIDELPQETKMPSIQSDYAIQGDLYSQKANDGPTAENTMKSELPPISLLPNYASNSVLKSKTTKKSTPIASGSKGAKGYGQQVSKHTTQAGKSILNPGPSNVTMANPTESSTISTRRRHGGGNGSKYSHRSSTNKRVGNGHNSKLKTNGASGVELYGGMT